MRRAALFALLAVLLLPALLQSASANTATTWNTTGAFDSGDKGTTPYVGQVGQWSFRAPIPNAVADLASVTYGSSIYVFGGYAGGATAPTNYTQVYDATSDTWTQAATFPTKRWGAAAARYADRAYVFGGDVDGSSTGSNKNEAINLTTGAWATKTAVPAAMAHQGLMAATVGDGIYVFYGTTAYVYYPGNDSWFAKTSSSKSRTWCSVSVVGTDVYLIGGYTGTVASNDVRIFHTASDSWNDAYDTAPYTAWGMVREAPTNGSVIYEAMGFSGSAFFANVYAYYYATKTWVRYVDAPHALDGPASGMVDGKLYILGGRDFSLNPVGTTFNQEIAFVTPNDGNYQVETSSDNGLVPLDSFKLRGYGGDRYDFEYPNGSNAKWTWAMTAASDPTRCSLVHEIAGLALYLHDTVAGNQNCNSISRLAKEITSDFDLRVHFALISGSSGNVIFRVTNGTTYGSAIANGLQVAIGVTG
ncbi:MAG: hypothetical protein LUO93_11810, partial [Methanomicrobiales archaeon]|nr:hypothetical protein [Methanomicrobiales archaeon]